MRKLLGQQQAIADTNSRHDELETMEVGDAEISYNLFSDIEPMEEDRSNDVEDLNVPLDDKESSHDLSTDFEPMEEDRSNVHVGVAEISDDSFGDLHSIVIKNKKRNTL